MALDILCEDYEICERYASHIDMVTKGIIVTSKCDIYAYNYI